MYNYNLIISYEQTDIMHTRQSLLKEIKVNKRNILDSSQGYVGTL